MEDIVIVGAGVIGLLAAKQLSDQGRNVCVLSATPQRPTASWAGGGILSPLFPWRYDAAVTCLSDDAVARYRSLQAEFLCEGLPDIEVNPCGLLVLGEPGPDAAIDWCRAHDFHVETDRADRFQPGMGDEPALWLPELGAVRNSRLLAVLEASLQKRHASLHKARVKQLARVANGWQAVSDEGVFTGRQLLVAAGAWSTELLSPLGVSLPVSPVKGQIALYESAADALKTVVLTDHGYLIPRRDGRVLVGSTLETSVTDMLPDLAGQQQLEGTFQRLWKTGAPAHPLMQWAGWRPGNLSDIPFIGEIDSQPGLFVCCGHYRNGICTAPASVALLVAQMCGLPLPFDASPYALPFYDFNHATLPK